MRIGEDTIAAVGTPPGRGGIAIIRISGCEVINIMRGILGMTIEPRKAIYSNFYNANNEPIDQGLALFFAKPHSFTGEDVLELHGHGSPVLIDLLLKRIFEIGARLADPGEFSMRAFLNGKIDLAQAEAIADLINASSQQAARSAMRSLQGEFSCAIVALCERIINLRLYIEAAIDFSDEEIDLLNDASIANALCTILDDLRDLLARAKQGSLLREGVNVVIVGKPNVGKSSLMNRLSGKEHAIVTNIPGTTRDILRDNIVLDGIPIHIKDTAGLRVSDDPVEQEGIKRSYQAMETADVILFMRDIEEEVDAEDDAYILPEREYGERCLFIRNKIDLTEESPHADEKCVSLSAKTGAGLDLLVKAIKKKIGVNEEQQGVFLARRRHLQALHTTKLHISNCLLHLQNVSSELSAEDLRLAQLALNEITGDFNADDLLGRIFSTFCIGK